MKHLGAVGRHRRLRRQSHLKLIVSTLMEGERRRCWRRDDDDGGQDDDDDEQRPADHGVDSHC